MEKKLKGQIIGGSFSELVMRQKSDGSVELGELLISESDAGKMLMKVTDVRYGSQISSLNLELASGMRLEENSDVNFMEPELRNYTIAILKPLALISGNYARLTKSLPDFFSEVYSVTENELKFLTKPTNPLFAGYLRSGTALFDMPLYLPGNKVLAHHILIPATTGRGKSNLTSCMLWDCVDKDYCGILVLDPHDEYYGRNSDGLKDHPIKNVVYYTPKNPPAGTRTLKINLETLRPEHFRGVVDWSDPQSEAIHAYHREYKEKWIQSLLAEEELTNMRDFNEMTISVVRRKVMGILRLKVRDGRIIDDGLFSIQAGQTTLSDIVKELEQGKIVIIDTSLFEGSVEILIGSVISSEIFKRYKRYKVDGNLSEKPVISIVLEEAPRVLGKEVLEKGQNIFSQIAREGRKFKVGLWAITQLPSLIPRQILANMNTKIILGLEMAPERQAIIESAAQDLSKDDRAIASLDIGEAIITSNFTRFATPLKIPIFKDIIAKTKNEHIASKAKMEFVGLK